MKWTIDDTRKEILDDESRYKILVCGRRWGKTYFSLMWLLSQDLQQDERRWILYPSYRQAKMVAWGVLKKIFRDRQVKINESELSVTLQNGAKIEFKGADKEDSLRGVSLTSCVLDEYAFMKKKCLGRNSTTHVGTNERKSFVYRNANRHTESFL